MYHIFIYLIHKNNNKIYKLVFYLLWGNNGQLLPFQSYQ